MQPEKIPLWNGQAPVGDGSTEASAQKMLLYRPEKPNGAAIIICPGGGYGTLVMGPEGEGIGKWLQTKGITGIVLPYRLPNGNPFLPMSDVQQAIRLTRIYAKEWQINPARVGVMGFSAGGHLASSAGTHFEKSDLNDGGYSCRPDFMILIYPVISMGRLGHQGSTGNFLGPGANAESIKLYSNEEQVTAKTPPAFLAHAVDDVPVPVANSRMFYEALQKNGISSSRFLELPEGGHGLNGYKGPSWEAWKKGSLEWLAELGFIPPPS